MIPTNKGALTEEQLTKELIYACYRYNRETAPHITPAAWASVLPNVPAMERRYQQDCADYADFMSRRDQAARHEGRPDHDLTTRGEPMKAGR
jgi:hypothetical protein